MNKLITQSVKVALTTGALATALTGCCRSVSEEVADRSAAPQTQVADRSPA